MRQYWKQQFFTASSGQYAVALAAVTLALVLRWILAPWVGESGRTITLFGAIAVAVWYGGFLPGLVAAVVGYLGVALFFLKGGLGFGEPGDVARFFGYAVSGLIIIALGAAMHAARKRAEAAEAELRGNVAELKA